ncbi:MAG TPA: efflux transporter outer membrane subunit [Tepidisphaeraceae bacterium]|nr:efflux transporter outer membrane subunit [Tepidisphaeraceae bacterium]
MKITQPRNVSKALCIPAAAFCMLPLLGSGCTVGPDYHPPQTQMPAKWIAPTTMPAATQPSVVAPLPADVAQWWKSFRDPQLDALVAQAVTCNLDVRMATARLRAARAQRGISGAALLPEIDANGNYSREGFGKGNVRAFPGPHGTTITKNTAFRANQYQAGFDSSWELDIFGGTRRDIESADQNIAAAVEDRRDVLVTLISEVAVDYISLRGTQEEIKIAHENLDSEQHTAEVTRKKFGAGFLAKLDVSNADAQVYSTQSDIPALEIMERQQIYALSLLLGREPAALLADLSPPGTIPFTPPVVPIGLPAELLRRRPDIRRAEAQLHSATAQIGVATADLYPKISLLGSLQLSSGQLKGLSNWANNAWNIGPAVSWPLFSGGRIQANIELQNAQTENALLVYKQTVLTALQEVESALIAYSKEQQRRDALEKAVAANTAARNVANQLYQTGQTDFLNVLNAERSLYGAQLALTQSDTNIATDLAALYKALGGGWEAGPADAAR